tara:strand:- start:432 stop:677 length:246 start_codon:yes stop_codon:yes gene_type:complete
MINKIKEKIDNQAWAEKWRIIDGVKLLWQDMGLHSEFEQVIERIMDRREELSHEGVFQSKRFDNTDKQYSHTIIVLLKEID